MEISMGAPFVFYILKNVVHAFACLFRATHCANVKWKLLGVLETILLNDCRFVCQRIARREFVCWIADGCLNRVFEDGVGSKIRRSKFHVGGCVTKWFWPLCILALQRFTRIGNWMLRALIPFANGCFRGSRPRAHLDNLEMLEFEDVQKSSNSNWMLRPIW